LINEYYTHKQHEKEGEKRDWRVGEVMMDGVIGKGVREERDEGVIRYRSVIGE
jgi:hypothetical protein